MLAGVEDADDSGRGQPGGASDVAEQPRLFERLGRRKQPQDVDVHVEQLVPGDDRPPGWSVAGEGVAPQQDGHRRTAPAPPLPTGAAGARTAAGSGGSSMT